VGAVVAQNAAVDTGFKAINGLGLHRFSLPQMYQLLNSLRW
jgi:hypothetical protein